MSNKHIYEDYDRSKVLTGVFKSAAPVAVVETHQEPEKQGTFSKIIAAIRGPQKYRYLGVNFWNDERVRYYRTDDRSIRKGRVVMVPVDDGPDRPAVVVSAKWYSEAYAPYPLKRTPMITGLGGFRDQVKFDFAQMKKKSAERKERREERREGRCGWLWTLIFLDIFFDD